MGFPAPFLPLKHHFSPERTLDLKAAEKNNKLYKLSFNPFHAIGLFLYPLKTSKSQRFSDAFSGYRKTPVT